MIRQNWVSVLEKAFTERVVLMPGAIEMVKTMNKMGAKTVLVSGGFTFLKSLSLVLRNVHHLHIMMKILTLAISH